MNQEPLIFMDKVSRNYGEGFSVVHALKEVTFKLSCLERVLVMGPSGSGKTTFLSIVGCLLRASAGRLCVRGVNIASKPEKDLVQVRAENFGFIFQDPHLFPALSAIENVALTLQMKNEDCENPYQEASKLLDRVKVAHRSHAMPHELSGGEKQRVSIARALAGNPPVILGDEPTASLDTHTAMEIMNLLNELAEQEGHAFLVVTHDSRLEKFATRVVRIEDGELKNY